jgi:hypothetical protein
MADFELKTEMTVSGLRDHFATMALGSLAAKALNRRQNALTLTNHDIILLSGLCYRIADAMLEARKGGK